MSLLRPRFIETPAGRLFLQCWRPAGVPRGALLVLPPFAEEMNRSRPQLALLGRGLALAGYAVLLPDLHGTGDSDGDFAEATVQGWQQDLAAVAVHAAAEGLVIDTLLGVRFGALLAASALTSLPSARRLLLWQPVLTGEAVLTQQLRTRAAAAMMADGQAGEIVAGLQQRLAGGQSLEVAGYEISAALASGLRELRLPPVLPADLAGSLAVHWLEVVSSTESPVSRPAAQLLEQWRAAGHPVAHRRLPGELFWTSAEISLCPALVEASRESLDG